jgi:hypothetical protein
VERTSSLNLTVFPLLGVPGGGENLLLGCDTLPGGALLIDLTDLTPEIFLAEVWDLIETLEELWGNFVGFVVVELILSLITGLNEIYP